VVLLQADPHSSSATAVPPTTVPPRTPWLQLRRPPGTGDGYPGGCYRDDCAYFGADDLRHDPCRPINDGGWSQATYEGAQYVVSKMPGSKLVYVDNSYNQKTTPVQQAEQLLAQGAKVVYFNSDSFMDDSNSFATAHPDV